GDRRYVPQLLAAAVGLEEIPQEGRDRIAVVADRPFDTSHELLHLRIAEVGIDDRRPPHCRDIRADERVQTRGRDGRIRFPELERPPLRVTESLPSTGVPREGEQLGPADVSR